MSGIDPSPELMKYFEEMKLRQKHKFLVFSLRKVGMDGNKAVWDWQIEGAESRQGIGSATPSGSPIVDSANTNMTVWNAMVKSLPSDAGKFILYDWNTRAKDGRIVQKLLLVKWCPDTVDIGTKMIMGSTYQTLKQKLQGLGRDVQAVEPGDLEFSYMERLMLEA